MGDHRSDPRPQANGAQQRPQGFAMRGHGLCEADANGLLGLLLRIAV